MHADFDLLCNGGIGHVEQPEHDHNPPILASP
jgi:hypothetical protein